MGESKAISVKVGRFCFVHQRTSHSKIYTRCESYALEIKSLN